MLRATTKSSSAAILLALTFGTAACTPVLAQPELVGSWTTHDGEIIAVEQCGNAYCATVASGQHAGATVAHVSGTGPEFTGEVHDPRNGKSYPGSLTLNGGSVALKGCIMEVFCKTVQHWRRAG